jgi:hypothetical protein
MNIKALEKIEGAWIKYNWDFLKERQTIPFGVLVSIVDIIERFYKNKSAKELVLMKIHGLPAYIVVHRNDYKELLSWLQEKFIELEMFEICARIQSIKQKVV